MEISGASICNQRLRKKGYLPSSLVSTSKLAIIILSLIIHFFTQNTQLVPKVSSRAWHPLILSTVVVTPSPVGSHFLSEGTLSEKEWNECSFRHRPDLYLVGLCLWWPFVYIFQSLQISGCFSGWWSKNTISSRLCLQFTAVIPSKMKCLFC